MRLELMLRQLQKVALNKCQVATTERVLSNSTSIPGFDKARDARWNRRRFLACGTLFGTALWTGWSINCLHSAPARKGASFPPSDSWPNFRNGPDLRGIAQTKLPKSPKLVWEKEAPDGCQSTPAIVDGHVYVGTLSGYLHCWTLREGRELWKYASKETSDPKAFIPGFSSPVTVTERYVLAGDEEGTMHCIDRKTGQKKWQVDTEGLVVGGASQIGDRVIFGSHGQVLYCVQLESGETVWTYDVQGPVNGTQAVAGEFTFVTDCGSPVLYVINTTTGKQETKIPLKDLLIATPALRDDVLYFGTSEGLVLAVHWKEQKEVWSFEMDQGGEVHSSPAVTDDHVYICGPDKSLYCLDRRTGKKVWKFSTRSGNDNSPVVVGDRLFFGSGDRNVYAIRLKDGSEQWKFNAGLPFKESSPAVAEGHLVICTERAGGRILCFG